MIALRHPSHAPTPPARFHPLPLVAVLMSVMRLRRSKARAKPNPDWEKDEPMSGLS